MRSARWLMGLALFGCSLGLAAQEVTIDFEELTGPNFLSSAEPPLTVHSATFSGGAIVTGGPTAPPVDTTTVYATASFCTGCSPRIVINFSQPVSDLSFFLVNGLDSEEMYTIENDAGDRQSVSVPSSASDGAVTVEVPGNKISSVTIESASPQWDFGIDDVIFMHPASLIDPEAAGLVSVVSGFSISANPEELAAAVEIVEGVSADGVAQAVVRIPAGDVGDEITIAVVNNAGAPSGSLAEDGGLTPIGGGQPASEVTVIAVATSQGPMAFAVFHAPRDFARNAGDANLASRSVSLEIVADDGSTSSLDVLIARPPVVLIHGLWGDPSNWEDFTPLVGNASFYVARVNYSGAVPIIKASAPSYPPKFLQMVKQNALGFEYNARTALIQLDIFINDFRCARKVAAAQADVVAHSMGGLVARTMTLFTCSDNDGQGPCFLSSHNYGQGPIHKLITIATPHLGTPLASQLTTDDNLCVRKILADAGEVSLLSVTLASGTIINGAVGDLAGDGKGGALSAALADLPTEQPFPTAYIAGEETASNLAGLDNFFHPQPRVIRAICNAEHRTSPLAEALTPDGWRSVFGQDNDAIVPLTSQKNLVANAIVVSGLVHSRGSENLGFNGSAELDQASQIPIIVIDLLNESIDGSHFNH